MATLTTAGGKKFTVAPKAKAQVTVQPRAQYDAGGSGRRMRGWMPASTGPNKAITGLQNIRNRSRDANRNDWSGESSTQKWTTNLIGIGITPRFKRIKSKTRKQFLTDLWDDFVAQSDADGVLNLYGQQTLGVRAWMESGEFFMRRRYRRISEGLAVPLQIQLIEADYVPLLDADTWPGMPTGNRIRSGIEFSKTSRRVAYWVYKEHPGDGQGRTIGANDLVRIPAEDMKHVFEQKRIGQLRGVPGLAPVLARLRSIGDYDDAVLERQKLANLFVAFITRNMPADGDTDPLTGLPIEFANGEPFAGMQPGMTQELDPGQDVKFANPPEAGTTYSDYMRTQNMGTAAASGLPYEVFSGDIANVSDRTLRVIIQEFRRFCEQRQWQVIIPMMCKPVVEWFAEAGVLADKIRLNEVDSVRRAEHSPHGWQHIHPVQDPQGKALEVKEGFRSRSSVIAERGDDPDTVDDERQADEAREKQLGITFKDAAPAATEPTKPKPKKAEPTQLDTAFATLTALLGAQQTQINNLATAKPADQQPVNVTVNNAQAPVTVQNNVEPTPLTVQNNVEPAPVNNVVNVEQPVVNVAAPNVAIENVVPPAEVNVHLPVRKTETTVAYDNNGNITNTTQIESDVE